MKQNIVAFMDKCKSEPEFMQQERDLLSTKWLAIKYDVSEMIVCKYLWKEKPRVFPDTNEVDKMRKYKSDYKTAQHFWVSTQWIKNNCSHIERKPRSGLIKERMDLWKTQIQIAKDLWISVASVGYHWHKILNPYTVKSPTTLAKESLPPERVLNTGKWERKEHTYEVYGELVQVWSRPLPWVKLKPYSGVPYLM